MDEWKPLPLPGSLTRAGAAARLSVRHTTAGVALRTPPRRAAAAGRATGGQGLAPPYPCQLNCQHSCQHSSPGAFIPVTTQGFTNSQGTPCPARDVGTKNMYSFGGTLRANSEGRRFCGPAGTRALSAAALHDIFS